MRWARKEAQYLRFYLGSISGHKIYFGNIKAYGNDSAETNAAIKTRFKRLLRKHHPSIRLHAIDEVNARDEVHAHYCLISEVPISQATVKRLYDEAAYPLNTVVEHDKVRLSLSGAVAYMMKARQQDDSGQIRLFKTAKQGLSIQQVWAHRDFWALYPGGKAAVENVVSSLWKRRFDAGLPEVECWSDGESDRRESIARARARVKCEWQQGGLDDGQCKGNDGGLPDLEHDQRNGLCGSGAAAGGTMTNDIPPGIYRCEFIGAASDNPKRYCWQFRITTGPHAGKVIYRPTWAKHWNQRCSEMIRQLTEAIDGQPLPGNEFHPILYEGSIVRVVMTLGPNGGCWPTSILPDRTIRVRLH